MARSPLSDISSMITASLAAASGAALVLSIIHELVYYYIVGIKFLALLDTVDYIKQAIYWMPFVLFNSFMLTGTYTYMLDYREKVTVDATDTRYIDKVKKINKKLRVYVIFVIPAMMIIIVLLIGYFFGPQVLGLVSVPIGYWLSWTIVKTLSVKAWSIKGASIFIPVAVIGLSISIAFAEAYTGLRRTDANFNIRLSDPEVVQRVVILRLFGRGALIRHPDTRTIEFVPSDRIKAISTF